MQQLRSLTLVSMIFGMLWAGWVKGLVLWLGGYTPGIVILIGALMLLGIMWYLLEYYADVQRSLLGSVMPKFYYQRKIYWWVSAKATRIWGALKERLSSRK